MANKTPEQEPEATVLAATDILLAQTGTIGSRAVKYIQASNAGASLAGRAVTSIPGVLINGKISVTVASNNITVAIKTISGNNPSATEPVFCRISDTMRAITAALSVTVNAATNTFNSGSAELATQEVDYFAYLGYNATDGVTLGFARFPYACVYSDFSTTATNDKYAAISNIAHAAAGDDYTVIGRFAATLSAGAGYTWTVPTYTTINLVQRPIYETRKLSWTITVANLTIGSGTRVATYQRKGEVTRIDADITLAADSSIGGAATFTPPVGHNMNATVHPIGQVNFRDANVGTYLGMLEYNNATLFRIRAASVSGSYIVAAALSSTIPFTWTTSDEIELYGLYY